MLCLVAKSKELIIEISLYRLAMDHLCHKTSSTRGKYVHASDLNSNRTVGSQIAMVHLLGFRVTY
jgi:hypothetical protein